MRIGVVADGMLLERSDDVDAMATLKRARFLSNDLESRLNALFREEGRQPLSGIIARRKDVVFSIEPEGDIDFSGSGSLGASVRTYEDEHINEASDAREESQSSHRL
jgi:hypothetical protein